MSEDENNNKIKKLTNNYNNNINQSIISNVNFLDFDKFT